MLDFLNGRIYNMAMEKKLLNTVRTVRRAADMTQEELAERVGVTRQTILAIEKGNYTPSVTLAILIAEQLRKPVEELFQIHREGTDASSC